MSDPIAVTVLGGYLGAGKTTLLNHVLRHADARIAVIVNDFGSVNIDAALVAGAAGGTITLENGCICCSLADGLAVALDRVEAASPRPARLLIEASGVADPTSIAAYAHTDVLRLDGVVVVVDAETVAAKVRDRWVGDVVERQIRGADVLVVNKTDLVDGQRRSAVHGLLGSLAPGVPRIEAVGAAVPLDALLGVERVAAVPSDAPPPSADERFRAWAETGEGLYDVDAIVRALMTVSPVPVRVKGVVRAAPDGRRVVIQGVGRRVVATEDGAWRGGPSQLVAITVRDGDGAGSPLTCLLGPSTATEVTAPARPGDPA